MYSVRDAFLACFEPEMIPYVIEFGKTISDVNADVYVLMARKAACFVDCLQALQLAVLDGYVTTDRILEMDASWIRNRNVAIIDDALISGSTLYRTKKRLVVCQGSI